MKKRLCIALCFVLSLFLFGIFCACGSPEVLYFYLPDGTPVLSAASLLNADGIAGRKVESRIVTGDVAVSRVKSGEASFAILPTNTAAKLYNAGLPYVMFSAEVFGSLYVYGVEKLQSLSELSGKLVYSIGFASTPEYVMKYILQAEGLVCENGDKAKENVVTFKYVDSGATIQALMLDGAAEYCLLGEPDAIKLEAAGKDRNITELFDLQKLWNKASNTKGGYPQACFVIKKDFLGDEALLKELNGILGANKLFIEQNTKLLKDLFAKCGSKINFDYTAELIQRCNVGFVSASNIKADAETYFSALLDFDKATLGGRLPDEHFYFKGISQIINKQRITG